MPGLKMATSIQTMVDHWLKLWICSVFILNNLNSQVEGNSFVDYTFIGSAVTKGAVCLDGSPPAYAFDKGSGDGANNWVVFLEGGGWCTSKTDCLERSKGKLGSSSLNNKTYFSGILDNNQAFNPDFYNWNKVYVAYCDGASFMADSEEVDPETKLNFRGARVFDAVMEDLLEKGMKNADNAILSGSSAGGLSTILHCDKFRSLIPNASRVKCISDSGFFIHGKNLPGVNIREDRFADVIATHRLAKVLPVSCTSKMDPRLCLFPENLVGDIQTPLFLLEAAFEKWQIQENLIPSVGGLPRWSNCIANFTLCTSTELQIMKDFRDAFIKTLQKVVANKSSSRGLFVHSCYVHGHITGKKGWTCSCVEGNNVLGNKTIGKAISDWYFDRSPFQEIDFKNDLPKNCNSTLTMEEFNKKCTNTCGLN